MDTGLINLCLFLTCIDKAFSVLNILVTSRKCGLLVDLAADPDRVLFLDYDGAGFPGQCVINILNNNTDEKICIKAYEEFGCPSDFTYYVGNLSSAAEEHSHKCHEFLLSPRCDQTDIAYVVFERSSNTEEARFKIYSVNISLPATRQTPTRTLEGSGADKITVQTAVGIGLGTGGAILVIVTVLVCSVAYRRKWFTNIPPTNYNDHPPPYEAAIQQHQ